MTLGNHPLKVICEDDIERTYHPGANARRGYVYVNGKRVYGVRRNVYTAALGFHKTFQATGMYAWRVQPAAYETATA